jgi:mRNA-degrading endonuclease toxin of MazEF toxin-antitoxin module
MTREVWLTALDPVRGSGQAGTRPVLVLQPDPLNAFLRAVVIGPFVVHLKHDVQPDREAPPNVAQVLPDARPPRERI